MEQESQQGGEQSGQNQEHVCRQWKIHLSLFRKASWKYIESLIQLGAPKTEDTINYILQLLLSFLIFLTLFYLL